MMGDTVPEVPNGSQVLISGGASNLTYQYDASGNRTGVVTGSTQANYLVTPGGSTQLVSDATGTVSSGFVYGASGVWETD